jgi:hypothetical protein
MFTFTVTRASGDDVNVPITVDFTVGGTATFSTDYTVSGATSFSATAGSILLPTGQASASFTITTVPDTVAEANETIILTPQAQAGVFVVGSGSAWTVTITNDDGSGGGTDPSFASVRLLLHLDSSVADSSSSNFTVTNTGVTISTATAKWGAGSGRFNGSGFLTIPTNAAFSRGTGDFCWEMWINPDTGSSSVQRNILCAPGGSANGLGLSNARRLIWWVDGIGNMISGTPAQLDEATWHYVAVTRTSGTTTIWVNGASYASFSNTASYDFSGWFIGSNAYNSRWLGFMDDIRFTSVARTITAAPTAAFPDN